jgi:hypothetical protein
MVTKLLQRPAIRTSLLLFCGAKVLFISVWMFSSDSLPIFNAGRFHQAYLRYGEHESISPLERGLGSWDAAHYLRIAAEGYVSGSPSNAFYPMFPILLQLSGVVVPLKPVFVALLLNSLLTVLAVIGIILLSEAKGIAYLGIPTIVILLSHPAAFFLSLPYSEALFLGLSVWAMYGMQTENFRVVWVCSALLPLTRAVGIFVFLPLLYEAAKKRNDIRRWMVCLAPLLGYIAYLTIMWVYTGSPSAGFSAQKMYPNQPSVINIVDLFSFFNAAINVNGLHGMRDSLLDRGMFLLVVCSSISVWKIDRAWFVYMLGIGLVPALSNHLMSYTRFSLMCVPCMFAIAKVTETSIGEKVFLLIVCAALGIQIVMLISFLNFYWAN